MNAPPELVDRHIEEMQLDADTKATSHRSHLVSFASRPEPKIENDTQPKSQNLLGEPTEFLFHVLVDRRVPRGGAERPEPIVTREAHGAPFRGELPRECCLTRPGQPAGENESNVAHNVQVQQTPSLNAGSYARAWGVVGGHP